MDNNRSSSFNIWANHRGGDPGALAMSTWPQMESDPLPVNLTVNKHTAVSHSPGASNASSAIASISYQHFDGQNPAPKRRIVDFETQNRLRTPNTYSFNDCLPIDLSPGNPTENTTRRSSYSSPQSYLISAHSPLSPDVTSTTDGSAAPRSKAEPYIHETINCVPAVIKRSDSMPEGSSDISSSLMSMAIPTVKPVLDSSKFLRALENDSKVCQICSDSAAGFHCGAFVCEACKKFFIRAHRQSVRNYTCAKSELGTSCVINKETRVSCTHCRYQKCLEVGMHPPGSGLLDVTKVASLPCVVCSTPASGFHFGVLTCEGCKGFFRRCMKDGKQPGSVCQKHNQCEKETSAKALCRVCRFLKCVKAGMTVAAAKIGRQPNSLRYSRIIEYHETKLADGVHITEQPDVKLPFDCLNEALQLQESFSHLKTTLLSYQDETFDHSFVTYEQFYHSLVNQYIHYYACISSFYSNTPEFMKCTEQDRVFLLKLSSYPVIVLLLSELYDLDNDRYSLFSIKSWRGGVERLTNFFPQYKTIISHFRDTGRRLKLLKLDDIELMLLSNLLVISTVNVAETEDIEKIESCQLSNVKLLTEHTSRTHGPRSNRLGSLMMLLSELRYQSHQHEQAMSTLSKECSPVSGETLLGAIEKTIKQCLEKASQMDSY